MKPQILIFCEGVTDQIFIADCLEEFYSITTNRVDKKVSTKKGKEEDKKEITFEYKSYLGEIIEVGGCSKLSNQLYISKFEDNTDLEGINIVIFDADYEGQPNGNKGYKACNQKLNDIQKDKDVEFEHYIWFDYDNEQKDGVIESLLRKLIPKDKEPIFQCIESHQNCLKSLAIDNLRYAELKDKVGFYLYTSNEKSEARVRNYRNKAFWNLNTDEISDLKKFKEFLDKFFK